MEGSTLLRDLRVLEFGFRKVVHRRKEDLQCVESLKAASSLDRGLRSSGHLFVKQGLQLS